MTRGIIIALLLLPALAAAQVCTITGTLYKSNGSVAANQVVTVSEVRALSGVLISAQVQTYRTTANGAVRLRVLKNSTCYVWADAMGMRGDNGKGAFVVVPDADTATIENLISRTAIYALSAGAVTGVTVQLLTDTLNANPRHIGRKEFSDSLDAHIPRTAGGVVDQTARDTASAARLRAETAVTLANAAGSTAATATNIANGKAGADSVHTQFAALYNLLGGKGDSDSLAQACAAAFAAFAKADTNALHAQKFKNILDTLIVHASAFVRNESDPTALAKISASLDSAFTAGARSVSTTGRIFAADDSITFVGEAGDVINAATGNVFRGTLGAADTLSISNMVDGQTITVIITQGNNYALGWTGIAWSGGTAPTLTATANKRDVFTFIRAGGVTYGSYVQNF